MNSRLTAGWGMDWQGVDSAKMDDPGVGRFRFVVASCDRGINKKGKPYVNVGCKVIHVINGNQKDKGKMKFEYLSLEPDRQPFTKAFFEGIGADHILVPTKGPEHAKGIMFEADIVINKASDGRAFKNMRNLEPFSYEEPEAGEEVEEAEEPGEEAEVEATEESEDVTPEDIQAMTLDDLKEFVADNEIQVDLTSIKGLKAKKQAVIDEIFDAESEPEPEPEPEPAPVKKIKKAPVKGAVGGRR